MTHYKLSCESEEYGEEIFLANFSQINNNYDSDTGFDGCLDLLDNKNGTSSHQHNCNEVEDMLDKYRPNHRGLDF